jgi:hypothetical protein
MEGTIEIYFDEEINKYKFKFKDETFMGDNDFYLTNDTLEGGLELFIKDVKKRGLLNR